MFLNKRRQISRIVSRIDNIDIFVMIDKITHHEGENDTHEQGNRLVASGKSAPAAGTDKGLPPLIVKVDLQIL